VCVCVCVCVCGCVCVCVCELTCRSLFFAKQKLKNHGVTLWLPLPSNNRRIIVVFAAKYLILSRLAEIKIKQLEQILCNLQYCTKEATAIHQLIGARVLCSSSMLAAGKMLPQYGLATGHSAVFPSSSTHQQHKKKRGTQPVSF